MELTAKESKYKALKDAEYEWPVSTCLTYDKKTLKLAGITDQQSERVSSLLTESCGYWSHHYTFLGRKGAFPPVVNGEDTAKSVIAGMALTAVLSGPSYSTLRKRFEKDDSYMITLQDFVRYSPSMYIP